MKLSALKKWSDSIQRSSNPVQRGLDSIQRCLNILWNKRVATIKVIQLIVTKDYTLFVIALMSNIKMAVRWIGTKQGAISERVETVMASWFPMMSMPCPVGAFVMVGKDQRFTTGSTASFLSFPSLLSYSSRKSHHKTTSQAGHYVPIKGGVQYVSRVKNGWSNTDIGGDTWVKVVNGKDITKLTFVKIPPEGRRARTMYAVWYNGRDIGHAFTRAGAIHIGDKLYKRLKHA